MAATSNSKYDPSFAREVFAKVDAGEEIKKCMQCGVCAASCPLADKMEFSPRKIFTMIRAGERDKVLSSKDIMLCTSCYTCIVRCPRKVPVMEVMHGLAHYALRNGFVPREDTAKFGKAFWDCIYNTGRVDEGVAARNFYLSSGFIEGAKKGMAMKDIALGMLKHKRMNVMGVIPGMQGKKIKEIASLQKMLKKAESMEKGGETK
jgi:quinone-modifying oxidoreductase subunit QmoC